MSSDELESRLKGLSIKPLPPEWRQAILSEAKEAMGSAPERLDSPTRFHWRDLLWPCPQAWLGLAGVWLVILVFNISAHTPSAPSWQTKTEIAQRSIRHEQVEERKFLTDWLEAFSLPLAEPPKGASGGTHSLILRARLSVV